MNATRTDTRSSTRASTHTGIGGRPDGWGIGRCRPLIGLVACAALAACSENDGSTNDSGGDDGRADGAIAWSPCADEAMLDCATLSAPLVHDAPDGRTIAVDLVRLPATGVGGETLIMNPGGPGGSGTELVRTFARLDALPESLREGHDIIGFDPRGVGASERIDCARFGVGDDTDYIIDDGGLQPLMDDTIAASDACVAEYGDVLSRLGSNAVVRDIELIREGLGAERLHFVGYSYGTRLAALYLQRYPERSGRFVLDGSVLPDSSLLALIEGQTSAGQGNLDAMLGACGTTVPDCDGETIDEAFVERARTILIDEDEDALELFGALIYLAVESIATGEFLAPVMLDYIRDGELEPLEELVAMLDTPDDEAPELANDNATVGRAVFCADDPARPTVDSLSTTLADLQMRSTVLAGAEIGFAALCAGWPEALDPVVPVRTASAPVALVIGGTGDANTPLAWSATMADAIGGVFLESEHDGHTSVFNDESDCVDATALAFLLDGTLPSLASCPSDDASEAFGR